MGKTKLFVTLCLGAAVGATACGAARSAPRAAGGEDVARIGQYCDTGMAAFERKEFAAAAEAFDHCIKADPNRAYAYYYAGLAYHEIDRADLMVARFEIFVRLAPDAPERLQVESILKTARG
jgi:tetratricopeptide (TPR) repeat protein